MSEEFLIMGLDEGAIQTNQNQSKKYSMKRWGMCLLIVGTMVTVIALLIFFFLTEAYLEQWANGLAEISPANEDMWKGVLVGNDDLGFEILRHHYLYNCTNYNDVVYKGAVPQYKEVGPYTYREFNKYEDVEYGVDMEIQEPGNSDGKVVRKAIKANYKQILTSVDKNAPDATSLDSPIYIVNKAALAYLHSQKESVKPLWETYI